MLTSAGMSGSSAVPSTWLCDGEDLLISVEPARGRPTMKIGSGAVQPPAFNECLGGERVDTAIDGGLSLGRIVRIGLQAERIAAE